MFSKQKFNRADLDKVKQGSPPRREAGGKGFVYSSLSLVLVSISQIL